MIADRESCRKYFVGEGLMEKVYDKCCGVDIHKKLIVACFKQAREKAGDPGVRCDNAGTAGDGRMA